MMKPHIRDAASLDGRCSTCRDFVTELLIDSIGFGPGSLKVETVSVVLCACGVVVEGPDGAEEVAEQPERRFQP